MQWMKHQLKGLQLWGFLTSKLFIKTSTLIKHHITTNKINSYDSSNTMFTTNVVLLLGGTLITPHHNHHNTKSQQMASSSRIICNTSTSTTTITSGFSSLLQMVLTTPEAIIKQTMAVKLIDTLINESTHTSAHRPADG